MANNLQAEELGHFYRLHLDSELSPTVKLTADHLVYIIDGGNIVVKAAGDVKIGEIVRTRYGDLAVLKKSSTMEYPARY